MSTTTTYRTTQGDAWDAIAVKLWPQSLRPELLAHHLMQANPEHMDVLIFPAGITLTVPDIITPTQKSATLPPWRTQ